MGKGVLDQMRAGGPRRRLRVHWLVGYVSVFLYENLFRLEWESNLYVYYIFNASPL